MKDDKYAKEEKYIITVVPHLDGLQDVCAHMHCSHTCTSAQNLTCCGEYAWVHI
jgi:hypothetical protein